MCVKSQCNSKCKINFTGVDPSLILFPGRCGSCNICDANGYHYHIEKTTDVVLKRQNHGVILNENGVPTSERGRMCPICMEKKNEEEYHFHIKDICPLIK